MCGRACAAISCVFQVWQSFTSRSEEEQVRILGSSEKRGGDKEGDGERVETPECRFRKIDRHIRVMLKHNKHLPIVSSYIPDIVFFFYYFAEQSNK